MVVEAAAGGGGGGAVITGFWESGDEACEVDDALVEMEGEREKVCPALLETELSDSRDMREMDLWRAIASYEFFLVCEGERLGITGGSTAPGETAVVVPAGLK
jgi:hypothetical protein